MSYHDFAARPWQTWEDWFNALSGGKLNMQKLDTKPVGFEIQKLASYPLMDPSFEAYGAPFNPSVVVFGGRLFVNVRVAGPKHALGQNFLAKLEDGVLKVFGRLIDASGIGDLQYGFEDLRLFDWRGELHAIAATSAPVTVGYPHNRQTVLRLWFTGTPTIVKAWPQHSTRHEKNWMPCVAGDTLKFVYATDPLTWLDFDGNSVSPAPDSVPMPPGTIRGGSQLVQYKNGWLSLVHQVHADSKLEKGAYLHRFAYFENGNSVVKLSEPFYFQHLGIEFAAGLAFFEGRWFASYGVEDREAWVSELSPETVDKLVGV